MGHLYHSYVSLPKGNWQPSEVGLHIWSSGRNMSKPEVSSLSSACWERDYHMDYDPQYIASYNPIYHQPTIIHHHSYPQKYPQYLEWWTSLNSLTIINHQPGIRPASQGPSPRWKWGRPAVVQGVQGPGEAPDLRGGHGEAAWTWGCLNRIGKTHRRPWFLTLEI